MCPEFLREGCSVGDFFAPPFVVLGTADPRTRESLTRLFAFLGVEPHHTGVGTAEALKYACNAFHATKVSFANEMARVFREFGVDTREVMRIFVQDTKLNASPAYLRPGFAYGGSCLPKDLRALQHMARTHSLDVPLLAGTAQTNDLVVQAVIDRIVSRGLGSVAMFGLSFKSDTDDLRESPNVELAERLIGKGFDLRIYDPIVNFERLRGSNRRHVEARLPHLARLLTTSPEQALEGSDVAVVSSADQEVIDTLLRTPPARVIDLHGRLGPEIEGLAGYEGVGW
jgi:GDP-mannose 6-dehydrogenase